MKTPQEIIDALPEGNRKRACILIQEGGVGSSLLAFWALMECGESDKAATLILEMSDNARACAILADMIWEG